MPEAYEPPFEMNQSGKKIRIIHAFFSYLIFIPVVSFVSIAQGLAINFQLSLSLFFRGYAFLTQQSEYFFSIFS